MIVLELCCFEWFQNEENVLVLSSTVLELCCFEWFQNLMICWHHSKNVLELCCFEWFQPTLKATHFLSSFFYSSLHIARHNPIPL